MDEITKLISFINILWKQPIPDISFSCYCCSNMNGPSQQCMAGYLMRILEQT